LAHACGRNEQRIYDKETKEREKEMKYHKAPGDEGNVGRIFSIKSVEKFV
jgi:hypothetical protein